MTFDQRAKIRIDRTIAAVEALWFPGAPYEPVPFARFNDELVRATAARDLTKIETACRKFEARMARRLTSARLEK